ncbi:MAG: hypothetical protein KGI25_06500 [Thaumarchaeota archaeon]|nr:hypothetical protein [Nitrososphaerota archaeon]
MSTKTIGIIIGGFAGGVIAISFAMMAGAAWETPGTYTGTSNAAHAPTSTTNCYSFQTGCKNTVTNIPQSQMDSGAYLSGNYQQ